jgi:hypothetical protein
MVTSNFSTVIIGLPSASPTRTSVKASDGVGRIEALAVPVTLTGCPRMRPASSSNVAR